MFWALICFGVALFVYFALIKPFEYWSKKGVASDKFWQLWLQIVQGLMRYRSIAEAIEKVYKDFPGVRYSGTYQFYKPVLSLRDPDLIKQITVKDFDHFVDHPQLLPEDFEPLLNNLLLLRGDQWRDMRQTLSPSFTSSKMKMMFNFISKCSKEFVQYFLEEDSKVVTVEMKDAFTRFTNDVIASTAFGVQCNSLKDRDNEFFLMGTKAVNTSIDFLNMMKSILFLMCPRFMKRLGIRFPNEDVRQFFKKVIKENIETRERESIVRLDMLHLLIETKKNRAKEVESVKDLAESTTVKTIEKRQLTDDDITAQAMIFFFAGFEVSATLMSFMAYELAVNPDIQQRLQQEVDNTLNDCDGSLTYEALSKMKYMDMVVSETLRKWPSALAIDRACVKPYTIQPTRNGERPLHLPEGFTVIIPVFGLHRDPEFYPDPERFDPERFSDENKPNLNPYAYLPFGMGPRSCIGNRFALMETKLVFFHLLTKFNIVVVEKTPIPIKLSREKFQLYPEGGFWMGLERRDALESSK